MDVSLPDLAQTHVGFFDLTFIRTRWPDASAMDDTQLILTLLDEDTTDPCAPNCIFDPAFYVRSHGIKTNPIHHYLTQGEREGLTPNALFDPAFFQRSCGTTADQAPSLVDHALRHFGPDLRPFHPFVDMDFIQKNQPATTMTDLQTRLFLGDLEPDHPHPLFDVTHLRTIADRPISGLRDAVQFYWSCGRDIATHPLFDVAYYLRHFAPDAGLCHSVYHYLISDQPRSPHPLLAAEFYRLQARETLGHAPRRPLEHYLTVGREMDLHPSPFFDPVFYRTASGCGTDALHHYVTGGHKRFAPHPMIDMVNGHLFTRASDAQTPLVQRLVQTPAKVPPEVTPDFDPVFYAKVVQNTSASPDKLRDQFMRSGYPHGGRPNGLLSTPYIDAQCRAVGLDDSRPVKGYFERAWQRRPRLLVALEHLNDCNANRAWLELFRGQLSNPSLEIILVAAQGGVLSEEFAKVAHLWHLSQRSAQTVPMAQLVQSCKHLHSILAANPPRVGFVQADGSTRLAQAIADPKTLMLAFGGAGLAQLPKDELTQLVQITQQILCDTDQVKNALSQRLGDDTQLDSGFQIDPEMPWDTDDRDTIRDGLDLPQKDIIIAASGPLDITNGVDLFGALAAHCLRQDRFENVTFLWHGTGMKHPHTPFFYAHHFVRTVAPAARLRIIDAPDLRTILNSADIYVQFGREGADGTGMTAAARAGLPVLATANHAEIPPCATPLAPFDLDAARDALGTLVDDPQARAHHGQACQTAFGMAPECPGLEAQVNAVLAGLTPDICLQPAAMAPPVRQLLLVVEDRMYRDIFAQLGRSVTQDGQPATVITALVQVLDQLPPDLRAPIGKSGCDQAVVITANPSLDHDLPTRFDTALWVTEGRLSELSQMYRLGLEFDRILVAKPALIIEMAKLNPRIAANMSALGEGAA